MNTITNRILKNLGDEELLDKLLSLPKSDLNSLLLELFKKQANVISPTELLKAYHSSRFSVPSEIDPVEYRSLEVALLTLAKEMKITNILLSPSAPLGSCSVFGCVDQYNVISAVRKLETLSDPSNMLAIMIADKLKNKLANNQVPLHYATTTRVIRTQNFTDKFSYAHFGIFCIVSSGKDSGSYVCEKELLVKHLTYYKKLFLEKFNARLSVVLRKRSGYTDNDGFFIRMTKLVKNELPDIPISFDLEHEDNQYYKGINFVIYMERNDEKIAIGDGGFVDWISKMIGNKKERCLISGIGIDRFLSLHHS